MNEVLSLSAVAISELRERIAKIVCCGGRCLLKNCNPGCVALSPEGPTLDTTELIIAALPFTPKPVLTATPGSAALLANRIEVIKPIKLKGMTGDFNNKCIIAATIPERDTIVEALRRLAAKPGEEGIDTARGNIRAAAEQLALDVREATIKECAKAAKNFDCEYQNAPSTKAGIIDAIRALSSTGEPKR